MNQPQLYQHNYRNNLTGEGREICISDGAESYYYQLAATDSPEDALDSFAASYDFNQDPDDDRDRAVQLRAEAYQDGVSVQVVYRTIRPEVRP